MRILLDKHSKECLLNFLKQKHSCENLKELSEKMNIPRNTLNGWMYNSKRYIPENFIPTEINDKLIILDKQKINWGQSKGGAKTYTIILEKYGLREIKQRQSNGGKKSRKNFEKPLEIAVTNPLFLEFYGILLGDGWISRLHYKNKIIHLVGISGHSQLDRDFFIYCKKNIEELFERRAYQKERPRYNSIELNFSHKMLFKFMNENLNFPIGKKINLNLPNEIFNLSFNLTRNIIRGIFDTDGSFYFDKTPQGNPYPCLSITMKSPMLMKQLYQIFLEQGFSPVYYEDKNEKVKITLKGKKQLLKWMNEIGSSNKKHLNKINPYLSLPK